MTNQSNIQAPGELRLSQLITTFGPGAMLDLPDAAVMVGGLDMWKGRRRAISEERLVSRLCEILGVKSLTLQEPPIDDEGPAGAPSGVTTMRFPLWFVATLDETHKSTDGRTYRTRPLVRWDHLVEGKYLSEDRKKIPVVPIRFVQACVRGHISDIDWYFFVRQEKSDNVGPLWLDESGAGNDFSEIFVRCERTNMRRALTNALMGTTLGLCAGRQPWLGWRSREACDKPNRLLTRSASNAYFTQTLSAISIPDEQEKVRVAVDEIWNDFLQYAEDAADVKRERRKERIMHALEGYTDEAVWAEVERRRSKTPPPARGIKQAEIETLMMVGPNPGKPDAEFSARTFSIETLPARYQGRVSRVVLVERLREVMALVGFTRFEASMPDIDGELDLGVQMAPLARELSWLPAVENRGEGVFVGISTKAITAWLARDAVQARGTSLEAGFETWKKKRKANRAEFPGLPYVMLHSLSHLLITSVAMSCGYSASSIRERIYAGDSGYGILLLTGGSGSEGTLGGLVEVGRSIDAYLDQAIEMGRLCSNDPICAQHDPTHPDEERFLHGSACHGCLLIAETSCERRNELLDRALVVPTVATPDAAFFFES